MTNTGKGAQADAGSRIRRLHEYDASRGLPTPGPGVEHSEG